MNQTDLPYGSSPPQSERSIPSVNAPGEPLLGDVCPNRSAPVSTDVWRYLKDTSGQQTGYIKRDHGRPVKDIAADLVKALNGMDYEWAILGQGYKYGWGTDTPNTECPQYAHLAVYTTSGGSEGHLVHVDLIINVPNEPSYQVSKKLFMAKVLTGSDEAQLIARKLEEVLGVL
jgi:hypothetical protein